MKKCNDCGEMKSFNDFYKGNGYCKICVKRRSKEYRLNNPERVRESKRKYGNSDKGKKKAKELREHNIEHYRAKVNQWHKDHLRYFSNRERKHSAELTDRYIKKLLRTSGTINPTPEQIQQRRELTLARRVNHALKPEFNSCRCCLHCGIFFKFKPGGRNLDGGKYCSSFCKNLASRKPLLPTSSFAYPRSNIAIINCGWCGKLFTARNTKMLYCSDECRDDNVKVLGRARGMADRGVNECKECGKSFIKSYGEGPRQFCSESCQNLNRKRAKRVCKSIRRARKRTNSCEPVDPIKVFERDGYICKICGCQTPITFRGSWLPYAPELDHIIPLSKGGEHTYKNTQCTCRACNQSKGNKIYVKPQRTQTRYREILPELRQIDRA